VPLRVLVRTKRDRTEANRYLFIPRGSNCTDQVRSVRFNNSPRPDYIKKSTHTQRIRSGGAPTARLPSDAPRYLLPLLFYFFLSFLILMLLGYFGYCDFFEFEFDFWVNQALVVYLIICFFQ